MKTICMIPARIGSKRIPKKNLRLLNGKPLIIYAIEAAKQAGIFDEIYINSDDEIFREIAQENGVKFYLRPANFASDNATNDEFTYDFLKAVDCETCFQLLCTSPFTSVQDILKFYVEYEKQEYTTLVATKKIQIECRFGGLELNYHVNEQTHPSQSLEAVIAYACSMMCWSKKTFCDTFEKQGGAYHGQFGNTGYFEVSGLSTIDIDNESDWTLAEKIMKSLSEKPDEPRYYEKKIIAKPGLQDERTMQGDGISVVNFKNENEQTVNIGTVIAQMPKNKSWSYRLVSSISGCATLIAQLQHERNRKHYHNSVDEWWRIEQGKYRFDIGTETITASVGDVVFVPRNTIHHIIATGEGLNIRLAVSQADAEHIYVD